MWIFDEGSFSNSLLIFRRHWIAKVGLKLDCATLCPLHPMATLLPTPWQSMLCPFIMDIILDRTQVKVQLEVRHFLCLIYGPWFSFQNKIPHRPSYKHSDKRVYGRVDVTKEIKWEERCCGKDKNVDRSRKSSVLHVKGLVTNVSVSQPCSCLPLPASTAVTAYQHCINVSLYCAWLNSPTRLRKRRQEGTGRKDGNNAEQRKTE